MKILLTTDTWVPAINGVVTSTATLRAPALNRAIRDLIDWRPDIVHSQCEFSTFAPARRIAHAAGAPLIHTYHTVYEDYTHYFSPSRSMGRKMAALFTRMICAGCDAVIAQTQPPVGGLRRALPDAHHPHGARPAALCCAPG